MKKRIWGILLAVCMVLALLPARAQAANVLVSGSCGANASWVLTDDGVMTITGTGTVTAPMDTETAFDYGTRVKTIKICEGITVIAERAFSSGLCYEEELILPDSLKIIGSYAFSANSQLKKVTFGSGLVTIEDSAFDGCRALTSVVLPDSLQYLCSGAFYSCGLREIVVPGTVKTVGRAAFGNCIELETAVISDGVQVLEGSVFEGCSRLQEVYLADSIRSLGFALFWGCGSLQEVRLPALTTAIPEGAFNYCRSLETVILPGTVRSIGRMAFETCPSLKALYYAGSEATLRAIQVDPTGNDVLENVPVYLIPSMPDPVFGLFDMPEPDNWAYPGVAFCLASGLMNGVGGGYFQPDGTTTRAQLVTILWRMMGEPKATKPAPFTDLTQDWYREAVAWAAENGITTGTSATAFSPDAPVTREQMVTIFYRVCRDYLELDVSPAASLAGFPDSASVSPWAQDALQWGVAVKLVNGVAAGGSVYLQPQGSATRAQIATVMRNFSNAFAGDTGA